ncbi:uncharacterized protein LOC110179040 [Drosophila serrata]|uniref:uncharacterized protein LOC110179040 n=1 Tax=Drosophila serrata TaxID=7274 RepID=UPI000A1D0891|nr:uncharacterized protein LOC110179040 [Drosophila serrata]
MKSLDREMKDLKRRPLHDERPTTPSEQEEQVDNRTLISESGGYEEGTSSSGEQEAPDDKSLPATPPGTPAAPADRSRRQSLPTYTPESALDSKHEQLPRSNALLYGAAIAGILVGCCFAFAFAPAPAKTCSFKSLRNVQPEQPDKVWLALQKGIEGLINKKDVHPSVFLFLHQNPKLQKLIDAIALEASNCYGGPSQLIHMSKEDFGPSLDNSGLAIERFKAKMKDGKVFLIVNLNEIAPNGARALHTICDTYSPIVEDAVIFLTLRTFNTTATRNSVQLATDTLYDLWSKELGDNVLDPLITRVTDQVLHLNG